MRQPAILMLDPAAPDLLGFIPTFLDADDARPAREQFQERYVFGGWRKQDGFTNNGLVLYYPGDAPLYPVAVMAMRNEMVCVYRYGYVAIFQPDGSFEASRLD